MWYARLTAGQSRRVEARETVAVIARAADTIVRIETETGYIRVPIDNGATFRLGPLYIRDVYVEDGEAEVFVGPEVMVGPPVGNLDVPLSTRASEATLQDILGRFGLAPYPITANTAKFIGSWNKVISIEAPFGYLWYSNDTTTPGAAEITFYGDKFAIMFYMDKDKGVANIYVDGQLIDQVDLYDAQAHWRAYFKDGLEDKEHVLRIEVSGLKNPSSTDYYVTVGGMFFPAAKNPFVITDRFSRTMTSYMRNYGLVVPYYSILTTTPLADGSAYASSWDDRSGYGFSYILVTVLADTDMDVYVEQSPNQSDITHVTHLSYSANDNQNNIVKAQLVDRYVRVRVVNNSGADQTKLIVARRFSMA